MDSIYIRRSCESEATTRLQAYQCRDLVWYTSWYGGMEWCWVWKLSMKTKLGLLVEATMLQSWQGLGRMATHTLLRSHYGNQQAISCCEALWVLGPSTLIAGAVHTMRGIDHSSTCTKRLPCLSIGYTGISTVNPLRTDWPDGMSSKVPKFHRLSLTD